MVNEKAEITMIDWEKGKIASGLYRKQRKDVCEKWHHEYEKSAAGQYYAWH